MSGFICRLVYIQLFVRLSTLTMANCEAERNDKECKARAKRSPFRVVAARVHLLYLQRYWSFSIPREKQKLKCNIMGYMIYNMVRETLCVHFAMLVPPYTH